MQKKAHYIRILEKKKKYFAHEISKKYFFATCPLLLILFQNVHSRVLNVKHAYTCARSSLYTVIYCRNL